MSTLHLVYAANSEGARDLGVDYAFMSLMTLAPDFAAANYTIHNEGGSDVGINIARLPYSFDLLKNENSHLQMEMDLAFQRTEQIVTTFSSPGESIDAEWDTYGAGLGLIYDLKLTRNLYFSPSFRYGIARMENHAIYNGTLTNAVKGQFEGIYFNWQTNARVTNLGMGLNYKWGMQDRNNLSATVYHILVESYSESNAAVAFTEKANMFTVKSDLIFPARFTLFDRRPDLVVLLGANHFFGENSNTLGYTTSYQGGIGVELPTRLDSRIHGRFRLSGQSLRAQNMEGWMLSLGFDQD